MQSERATGKRSRYSAFMFDMDGTILSSVTVIHRIWGRWAIKHGLDPNTLIPRIHGIRATDVIRSLALPGVDARAEALSIEAEELEDVDGIVPIPGAADFLRSLPRDRWAIVTSAPIALARRRIEAAGLPLPDIMIAGEDVSKGKPDPSCFRLGAQSLGASPQTCLVFEDSKAGIEAGSTAGCDVLVVTATHRDPLSTGHLQIVNFLEVQANCADGDLQIMFGTEGVV